MRLLPLFVLLLACPAADDGPPEEAPIPLAPENLNNGWNEFTPGGDTGCSRGDPFAYWVNPGTTNKVVIDFMGGGACWDDVTCSVADAIFTDSVDWLREAINADEGFGGIYDRSNPENPVGDYWHVVVPYCTGDIHWGNNRTWYGQGQNAFPIDHVGAVNTEAVFDWVFANFREPEQVLVTGCSAGSYGSALWSAHVMEHWPEADVVQFGDSGAGIITEQFFADSFPSWNAEPAFPAWIDALDPEQVSLLDKSLGDLYVGIADAYPNHKMSQFNTRLDATQVSYFEFMGGEEAEWSAGMLESVSDIESRASNFCNFTADGEQHCILGAENFYSMEADGVRVVDWLWGRLDGADGGSVSCLDCQ